MFTAASELFQLHAFVKLIIVVSVFRSIQPDAWASIDGEVQRVESPQHSLSPRGLEFAFGEVEKLDGGFDPLGERQGVSPPSAFFVLWIDV